MYNKEMNQNRNQNKKGTTYNPERKINGTGNVQTILKIILTWLKNSDFDIELPQESENGDKTHLK